MDKRNAIELMSGLLQDNLGNRITVALYHGILQQLDQELTRVAALQEMVDKGQLVEAPKE